VLYRSGLAMTLSLLARERVDDVAARAAGVEQAVAEHDLAPLPSADPAGFEALARRLDAHLLSAPRDGLVSTVCAVARGGAGRARVGRERPYVSSVLQIVGRALGYPPDVLSERLAA